MSDCFTYVDGRASFGEIETSEFSLTLTSDVAPVYSESVVPANIEASATATITMNAEAYDRWLGSASGAPAEPICTFQASYDLNPNDRRPRSLRQLLRQMRDIVVYEFRKAAGMHVSERLTMTIPNVRYLPQ